MPENFKPKYYKIVKNLQCPFCHKQADKESVERLSLRNINEVVLPLLKRQGLEIRKIRNK